MNYTKHLINHSCNLKEALKKIDKNKQGFIIITSDLEEVIGILTDGDIRRHLINKGNISEKVSQIMNKKFLFENEEASYEDIYKKLNNGIEFIPILNKSNKLVDIITTKNIPERKEKSFYARAKSPVRISFGGGGSDTTAFFSRSKGAVLNATISMYTYSTLFKRPDKKIKIYSLDLNKTLELNSVEDIDLKLNKDFNLIKALIITLNPKFGFELYLSSDFPIGSGLGGSACVLSSIIGCFNEFRSDKLNSYEIAEIAFEAERLLLGISGGWQDQYATVFGGFNFMEFNKSNNIVSPLRLSEGLKNELEANLVLCYTNTNHESGNIHNDQKKKLDNKEIFTIIEQNVKLVYEMKNLILKNDLKSFGLLLDKAWKNKRKFSSLISNSKLDDIYNEAKNNGAVGGKLLGAGGGGYFLFYVSPTKRNQLINWMKIQRLGYTPFKFEDHGLKSWKTRKI
jgi:D-glycero-alpha-D-manno-heptose-7-phosphate kinase